MIQTARLHLRPWQESDLPVLQALRNDVQLQAQLLANVRGSSLAAVRQWVQDRSQGADRLFFVVEPLDAQTPIGYLQLSDEAGATRTMRFGVCLAESHCGRGHGQELLLAAEAFVREQHAVDKLLLHVDAANARARHCYARLGYRDVGVMHRHVRIGAQLRDVAIMEKWIGRAAETGA